MVSSISEGDTTCVTGTEAVRKAITESTSASRLCLGIVGFATHDAISIYNRGIHRRLPANECHMIFSSALKWGGDESNLMTIEESITLASANAGNSETEDAKREYYRIPHVSIAWRELYRTSIQLAQEKVQQFILDEIGKLSHKERLTAVTIASPGFDFVLPAIGKDLEVISLSQKLIEACAENGIKRVGVIGTPIDICDDSSLVQGLYSLVSDGQLEEAVMLPLRLARYIALGVERGLWANIIYEDELRNMGDVCFDIATALWQKYSLDGLIVCNPELHETMLRLRKDSPELNIVDAADVHLAAINCFLNEKQDP